MQCSVWHMLVWWMAPSPSPRPTLGLPGPHHQVTHSYKPFQPAHTFIQWWMIPLVLCTKIRLLKVLVKISNREFYGKEHSQICFKAESQVNPKAENVLRFFCSTTGSFFLGLLTAVALAAVLDHECLYTFAKGFSANLYCHIFWELHCLCVWCVHCEVWPELHWVRISKFWCCYCWSVKWAPCGAKMSQRKQTCQNEKESLLDLGGYSDEYGDWMVLFRNFESIVRFGAQRQSGLRSDQLPISCLRLTLPTYLPATPAHSFP